jgi:hypothetical protein
MLVYPGFHPLDMKETNGIRKTVKAFYMSPSNCLVSLTHFVSHYR